MAAQVFVATEHSTLARNAPTVDDIATAWRRLLPVTRAWGEWLSVEPRVTRHANTDSLTSLFSTTAANVFTFAPTVDQNVAAPLVRAAMLEALQPIPDSAWTATSGPYVPATNGSSAWWSSGAATNSTRWVSEFPPLGLTSDNPTGPNTPEVYDTVLDQAYEIAVAVQNALQTRKPDPGELALAAGVGLAVGVLGTIGVGLWLSLRTRKR